MKPSVEPLNNQRGRIFYDKGAELWWLLQDERSTGPTVASIHGVLTSPMACTFTVTTYRTGSIENPESSSQFW